MCVTSDARVLFIQETWGSVKKLDKRCIEGLWHRSSAHCDVGKGLEVGVQSSWAQFKTVLLDTDGSFLVVVHNAWGLGVLGSVHMAQRSDDLLYNRQLVHPVYSLQQLPVSWLIVGGDWNRDIRTHKLSAGLIKLMGASVAFMQGRVHLPKDFCILKGVSGQSCGMWLREVGDHPVVWIRGFQTARAGAMGSLMRLVEPHNWDHDSRVIFSNLMEAMSLGISDVSSWLQAYRECISVLNIAASCPKSVEFLIELKSVVASLKAIAGGQGWKVQRSLEFRLYSKYWSTAITDWKAVSGPGLTGRTMKVLKLQPTNPFIALHHVTDTSSQSLVTGRDIQQVLLRECVFKYHVRNVTIPPEWVRSVMGHKYVLCPTSVAVEARRYLILSQEMQISVESLLRIRHKLTSATAGVDGFIPNLVKWMGLASLYRVSQILRLPFDQWPVEVFCALHLTLKKSAGDNVNANTRPIKLLSALFRIHAKLYAPLIQLATAPSESGCRQYAGFKGSSAHALRRMLHTLITHSLAVRGNVATMFLDFSSAFDEINKQAIPRVAGMYPFLSGIVHEMVHHYMSFRQYVVSALGLSESYRPVEGVLQGGGLDPLFYILAVNLVHLAMRQLGVGVPVCVPPSVETIASLGCVDDTVGFSSIDNRQRVANHLRIIIDCVRQRNNAF